MRSTFSTLSCCWLQKEDFGENSFLVKSEPTFLVLLLLALLQTDNKVEDSGRKNMRSGLLGFLGFPDNIDEL